MPRLMAFLTLSEGIFASLALAIAVRKAEFMSGLPPALRAAMVISLINLVYNAPFLASAAPFLCLILAHFECPDIRITSLIYQENRLLR